MKDLYTIFNEKHTRVYSILFGGVTAGNSHAEIAQWLKAHGHGALTICPSCLGTNFQHGIGCVYLSWFKYKFSREVVDAVVQSQR